MAITEKKESVTRTEERTKYVTSDNREFLNKSEAEVHEGFLKWQAEVARRGILNIENAYYCRTKEDYGVVVQMLAYKFGAYSWKKNQFIPFNCYEDTEFCGEDWYFFQHETEMDYPDNYWVETLSAKKKEFAEWLQPYEDAVNKE